MSRRVAIRRLPPAVVTLENDGDKFTVEGARAWNELVKAALGAALVGRAVCIVEDKHGGPLLTRELKSAPSSRVAESKSLSTICFESFRAADVDAFVDSPEFEARWVWTVVSPDPSMALQATDSIARAGNSIDLNQLPTTAEAIMSAHDGTEIWWLNAPRSAEALLADVASRSGWVVVPDFDE